MNPIFSGFFRIFYISTKNSLYYFSFIYVIYKINIISILLFLHNRIFISRHFKTNFFF